MDPAIKSKAVKMQLDRILGSNQFAGAFRIKRLLKFLVDETLAGRAEQIKAYTIGLGVFDREPDFDPQSDPIVRINAGRLRRHLNDYYENCNRNINIRIAISKGTYVPEFQIIHQFTGSQTSPENNVCVEPAENETRAGKPRVGYAEPVIAVLPFTYFGDGRAAIYLLDGFSDELSSGLALFQDLRVIDYFSMVQFRGLTIGVGEIGRQLGADFLITGSIKITESSMKVRVSLSDANNGVQIWTKVFHRSLSADSISDTLSEITERVIGAVAGDFGAIHRDRGHGIQDGTRTDLTHYEATFMHRHAQLTGNWEYSPQIKKALEKVLEVDPGYAMGWALLGEMYLDNYAHEYSDSGESLDLGYSFARNAVQRDVMCQYAHYILAYSHVLHRDPDNVIRAAEQVWKLNPNAAFLVGGASFWACIAGDFDRGLANLSRSIQLNPYYPGWFHHAWFLFHLKRGNYPEALAEAERFHMPDFFWSYLDKTVAAGLLGKLEVANAMLNKVIEHHPDFANHPRYYVSSFVIEEDLIEKMLGGLNKAGLRAI